MPFAFDPAPVPSLAIAGSTARFPVRRIYCIGRNYADHAREMGATVERSQPMFFMKPADAVVADEGGGVVVRYPQATAELHHEVELVVALARGGRDLAAGAALDGIFGYAVGLDLTRRDLQAAAKSKGHPWDAAKGFDQSAPLSLVHPASGAVPSSGRLSLAINGTTRQDADIADMVLPIGEVLAALSRLWELAPGDLVFTGTPAGVGALARGDRFEARFGDMARLEGRIA